MKTKNKGGKLKFKTLTGGWMGVSHPLVSSLPARIQFLRKVPQVIVVVEVAERNQVLKDENNLCQDQIT